MRLFYAKQFSLWFLFFYSRYYVNKFSSEHVYLYRTLHKFRKMPCVLLYDCKLVNYKLILIALYDYGK